VAVAAAAPVRIRYFVRLKLRLVRNGLRGQTGRVIGYVVGLFFGLWGAFMGFSLFLLSGAVPRADVGLVMASFTGSALVLGWLFLPLLFFGVDETLDPARFALLPLPPRTLAAGMLAAACVGIPGLATAVALAGAVVGAGLRGGAVAAVVGLVGAVLGLLLCVVLSRAVTSGFATLLRSRRVRDLTALLLALFAASVGPIQLFVNSLAVHTSFAPVVRVARVLGWTPLAAGFVAPYDVLDGRPLLAVVRLAIVAVTVLALSWWWSRTLESAMIGTSSGSATGGGPAEGGVVRALVPRLLRGARADTFLAGRHLGRTGKAAFVGIVAREVRYWSRDPRRRAGLISAVIGGAAVPLGLRLAGAKHSSGMPLPLAVAIPALIGAVLLGNQFGYDGTAYSMHLLTAVRGRTELRARAAALALILLPILLVLAVLLAVLTHDQARLVPAVGTIVGMLGTVMGVESVLSIYAAYPMPESRNAFSVSSGSGSVKALLALAGMLAAAALAAPVLILSAFAPGILVALVGIAYGAGMLLIGTYIGGDVLERRGPELLVAVTPRR
jgi:ABC-2 type transport system permease protein